MCGRYSLISSPDKLRAQLGYLEQPNFPPRDDVAPTQPIAIVRSAHGRKQFWLVRWGLAPAWVKDPSDFPLLINARMETAAEKPAFRAAMRHRRCVIPADGYYEWKPLGAQGKQRYLIRRRDGTPMAFAGLWETWSDPEGGEIDTGAILTREANAKIKDVHGRMPALVEARDMDAWLDVQNIRVKEAVKLLRPVDEDILEVVPVTALGEEVDVGMQTQMPAGKRRPVEGVSQPKSGAGSKRSEGKAGVAQLDLF